MKTSHSAKSKHRPLSSPERQVRIFSPVVLVATDLLAALITNVFQRSPVRRTPIGNNDLRIAVSLHGFLYEFQCRSLVTLLRDVAFKHFAFMIHRTPEVMLNPVDLYEHFIQVPLPLDKPAHGMRTQLAQLPGEQGAETVDPEPNTFMADIDTALMQQVFNIAK